MLETGVGGRSLGVGRFRSIRSHYDGSTSALLNPLIPTARTASQRLSTGLGSQTGRTLVAAARTTETAFLKSNDGMKKPQRCIQKRGKILAKVFAANA